MAQDDGSVHDISRGQHHRVSHQSVHQRIWSKTHSLEKTSKTKTCFLLNFQFHLSFAQLLFPHKATVWFFECAGSKMLYTILEEHVNQNVSSSSAPI